MESWADITERQEHAAVAANDCRGSCPAVRELFAAAAAAGGSIPAAPAAGPTIYVGDLEKTLEAYNVLGSIIAMRKEIENVPEVDDEEKEFLQGVHDRMCEEFVQLMGGYEKVAELRKTWDTVMDIHYAAQKEAYDAQKKRYEETRARRTEADWVYINYYKSMNEYYKELWEKARKCREVINDIIMVVNPEDLDL